MACGAGTIFRNYLVDMGAGRRGQTAGLQLDGLDALAEALDNRDARLWQMRNGYALATRQGLETVAQAVAGGRSEALRGRIRVGVQEDTEVTLDGAGHCVSQVYCSALPVAYGDHPTREWEGFARLVLDAAYEATLHVALGTGGPCYLTLLGGGAFGNRTDWIIAAMARALEMFRDRDLDVRIVSHGRASPAVAPLLARFG